MRTIDLTRQAPNVLEDVAPGESFLVVLTQPVAEEELVLGLPRGWAAKRQTEHTSLVEVPAGIANAQVHFRVRTRDSAGTFIEDFQYPLQVVNPAAPAAVPAGPNVPQGVANFLLNALQAGGGPVAGSPFQVGLTRTQGESTPDECLWQAIKESSQALSFGEYDLAIRGLCSRSNARDTILFDRVHDLYGRRNVLFSGTDGHAYLKAATEAFVIARSQVLEMFDPGGGKPPVPVYDFENNRDRTGLTSGSCDDQVEFLYLTAVARRLNIDLGDSSQSWCDAIDNRLRLPNLLELIWSYWQEEGMLVQAMNVITSRFQNTVPAGLANNLQSFELGPLRAINNLIWGHIQDEQHRLSVPRRVQEYDHHYGLKLQGRAVSRVQSADSRSKFIEAFHNLLSSAVQFYRQDDDTTVIADGFPMRNSLMDVHIILSQGAHNQFGDLPSTARVEMLMQQWIMSRPEIERFLPQREMVAYPEGWMGPVDAMKSLQGWNEVSAIQFNRLATFGEQIVLSVRYGSWATDLVNATNAVNWARAWRNEIQGYIHAYRVVTGVDLAADVTDNSAMSERYLQPATLIARRAAAQQRRPAAIPGGAPGRSIPAIGGRPPLPVPVRANRGPRP